MRTHYSFTDALKTCCLMALVALISTAPALAQTSFGPFSASPALTLGTGAGDDGYDGTLESMGSSTVNVSGVTGTSVVDIEVDVNINHTWPGDLVLKLVSPDGDILTLVSRPGYAETIDDGTGCCGLSADWLGSTVTFTDLGAADAEALTTPFTGTYFPNPGITNHPTQTFASLFGGTMNGDWTLYVGDAGGGDIATLNSWAIRITTVTPSLLAFVGVTVATDGDCTDDALPGTLNSTLNVAPGTGVCYFYYGENTGDVTLNLHDVQDDVFGSVINAVGYPLAPTTSAYVAVGPVTINNTVTNNATWDAYNPGPTDLASGSASATVFIIPDNDLCAGAVPLSCGTPVTGTTSGASAADNPADCGVFPDDLGVWYTFTGTGGDVELSTCGPVSEADGNRLWMSIFEGDCGSLTCSIENNPVDAECSSANGYLTATLATVNGANYHVFVTAFAGNPVTLDFNLTLNCGPLPCQNSSLWPSSAVTVDVTGEVTSISGCNYEEEYSIVTGISAGNTYNVVSTGGGQFITVRSGSVGGSVIASGYSPLQFVASTADDVFIHWSVDENCLTNQECISTSIQDLGQVCDNSSASGQWPTSAITPDAGGAVTTIANNLYAGSEYSVITGVISGYQYEFVHANGGYITVREGAANGPLVGSGSSPLTVQAGSTANLYVHWNVNDQCDTDATGSFQATVQNLGLPICDNTSASGQWPTSAITPDAGGAVTTISNNLYIGSEYSVITGIMAGSDYEFVNSGGAYITVREGAANGPVVDAGYSPLTVTAPSASDLYVHWTEDEFCSANATGSVAATVQLLLPPCDATAGTLTADASPVTLVGGSATISATEGTAPFVPTGYSVLYVLTEGAGLVIIDAAGTPSFTVTAAGDYTIHTLVYDPTTLDVSSVVFGTTTGFDVNALLIQGGGSICGALDVTGAPIVVEEEVVVTCDATAGTLTADASPVTLVGGSATISATEGTAPFVPAGFSVLYVLTEGAGLVIIDAAATPSFTVTATGDYTIHTLVYDPTTLDVSSVVFGTTTGFDVNGLLIQGGGSICGALDVTGAPIVVDEVVGISESLDRSLSVYPNPNNGQFIVELNGAEGVGTLNIMDMMGRRVYTAGVNFYGSFRQSIDLNVAKGTYVLQVITESGIATRKVELH